VNKKGGGRGRERDFDLTRGGGKEKRSKKVKIEEIHGTPKGKDQDLYIEGEGCQKKKGKQGTGKQPPRSAFRHFKGKGGTLVEGGVITFKIRTKRGAIKERS